jgi:hypothetical protein
VPTNLPTTGLTGRLILHAHTLDEVAVYDADGTELASRPLPPRRARPGRVDPRIGQPWLRVYDPWQPCQGRFRCGVEPL